MAKNLFRKADGVILQTKQCFDFFPEAIKNKAVILKNPVSQSFFRERFEGERENTITAVGRIDENKNHEMLIRAFAQIVDDYPDYKLIIYGEGELRKKLIGLVEELDLEEQISLPGATKEVAEAIYKTGVFVLSSNTEGVPNTLIEAMILGLTVVATDCPCGGPADLIEDGVNGFLTPVGDVNAMKENLQKALKNSQTAKTTGIEASKTADIYNTEKVYGEWSKYLKNLAFRRKT